MYSTEYLNHLTIVEILFNASTNCWIMLLWKVVIWSELIVSADTVLYIIIEQKCCLYQKLSVYKSKHRERHSVFSLTIRFDIIQNNHFTWFKRCRKWSTKLYLYNRWQQHIAKTKAFIHFYSVYSKSERSCFFSFRGFYW